MTTEETNELRVDLTTQVVEVFKTIPELAEKASYKQQVALVYVENGGTDKAAFERLRKEYFDTIDAQNAARKKTFNLLCKNYALDSGLEVSDTI